MVVEAIIEAIVEAEAEVVTEDVVEEVEAIKINSRASIKNKIFNNDSINKEVIIKEE